MSTKISNLSGPSPAPFGADRAVEKARDAVTGGSPVPTPAASFSGPGDVHITDSASQLAALEQAVRSLPAVDPARVAQFRSAIEQGTYTVQPQHVADQFIQLEQALGQLPQE